MLNRIRAALRLLRKYWIDLALLSASAACMTAFWVQYLDFERSTSSYAPLAELADGSVEVKHPGSISFEIASVGAKLYDLDAVWVPPGGSATLNIDDEQALLSERTFVMLRRPFKGKGYAGEKIRNLTGKVIIRSRFGFLTEQFPKPTFQEVPEKSKAQDAEKKLVDNTVYPAPSSVLFFRQGAPLELPLRWPESSQAFLVVSTSSNKSLAKYYPVQGNDTFAIPVEPGEEYVWQLIGSDSKVVRGPFAFETKTFDKAAVEALVRDQKRHVEILMESSPASRH